MTTEPTEKIVFLPATRDEGNASYHVAPELAKAFITFLKEQGVSPWLPPDDREKPEVEDIEIIEIKTQPGISIADLQSMGGKFLESNF